MSDVFDDVGGLANDILAVLDDLGVVDPEKVYSQIDNAREQAEYSWLDSNLPKILFFGLAGIALILFVAKRKGGY